MTTTNSKFAVTYTIDYTHRVVVGVTAPDSVAAIKLASDAFDAGLIWDDTEEMPLLFDDFEEVEGETLVYSAEQVSEFPEPDASVKAIRQKEFAFKACQALLAGQIDEARDFAMKAMPHVADALTTKVSSLVFQTEDSCLTSTEVIELAKDHDLKLSLYSAGIRFMHYLTSIPGGQYLHATMDGITRKINPEDFLDTYPDSLGKIWRLHAREIAIKPNVPDKTNWEVIDQSQYLLELYTQF